MVAGVRLYVPPYVESALPAPVPAGFGAAASVDDAVFSWDALATAADGPPETGAEADAEGAGLSPSDFGQPVKHARTKKSSEQRFIMCLPLPGSERHTPRRSGRA